MKGKSPQREKPTHVMIALTFVLAGAAIVTPGFRDALLSYINKHFALGLSLDAPWWVGLPLMSAGAGVYFIGESMAQRSEKVAAMAPTGTFVAVRHQSFESLANRLPNDAVPTRLGRRTIRHLECDQSSFLSGGTHDLASAVRQQTHLAADLAAVRRTDPEAVMGYYGIVHIPLQFLAGCAVSTWPEVALFELDRATNHWCELAEGNGPDLGVAVKWVTRPANPTTVVVRISISYNVTSADIAEVVHDSYEDICITIRKPHIDAVTHYQQVDAICQVFRSVLDDVHGRLDKSKIVHVFYAGPVSLGFSLGRRISRTIHHCVVVYNYTTHTLPRYAWGIKVNGDNAPETMVVCPVPVVKE